MQKATLAGGCYWCTEAIFQDFIGVESVVSGFTDGHMENPDYRSVVSGESGHVEAVEINFNPDVITYEELLEIFWTTHDPTSLNRQGKDIGTHYRSGIYTHRDEQREIAEKSKNEFATKLWDKPIVTEIKTATIFYPAKSYHQNYYKRNSHVGYCSVVIKPKVAKARAQFTNKIKVI